MGRLGRSYYVRAKGEAIHTIVQAVTRPAIGFDALPDNVRNSNVLSGNDLGKLAGMHSMPTWPESEILTLNDPKTIKLIAEKKPRLEFHRYAQEELKRMNIDFAMKILMVSEKLDYAEESA